MEHELALVKVRTTDANRAEVIKIVELYKGAIVDISAESVIVEAHGTEGRSTRWSRCSGRTASRKWSARERRSCSAAPARSRRL